MVKWNRKSGSRQSRVLATVFAGLVILTALAGCAVQKGNGKEGADPAAAPLPALVTSVKVENGKEADRVLIATRPDTVPYSVYRWTDPVRVVVDLSGVSPGQVPSTIPVADEFIQDVEVKTIPGDGSSLAQVRVIISLKDKNASYQTVREGGQVVVSINKAAPSAPNADLTAPPSNVVLVQTGDSLTIADPAAVSGAKATAASESSDALAAAAGKNLLAIKVVKETDLAKVQLNTDGIIGDYSAFTLKDPDRLVVDLYGLKNKSQVARQDINQQGILRVRVGEYPDKLRLVFDSVNKLPHFRFDKGQESLIVTFSASKDVSAGQEISVGVVSQTKRPAAAASEWPLMEVPAGENREASGPATKVAAPQPAATIADSNATPPDWGPTPTPTGTSGTLLPSRNARNESVTYIDSVKFDCSNTYSSITIHGDRPLRQDQWRREDNAGSDNQIIVSIFIESARVAPDLEKTFDTTEFKASPIRWFSIFQNRARPNEVDLVIVLDRWAGFLWEHSDHQLAFKFENNAGSLGIGGTTASGWLGPRGELIAGSAAKGSEYSGDLIDLDFYNADILEVFRVIAEAAGVNIVVDSDVRGRVTIRLKQVPWDQALDIILEIQGLAKTSEDSRSGKIIRIAAKSKLDRERQQRYVEKEMYKQFTDLDIRIIPVNYLMATELMTVIRPLLTPRGRAAADRRTNSLIVQDIPEVLDKIYRLIQDLDQPTQQVLIEARIVEATEGITREIGVQWGTNLNVGPATGNPTGLDFPQTIQVGGAVLGGAANAPGNSAVNSTGGGAVGMTFGSFTNQISLDVLLRALEAQEKIKIISSPRVLTLTDQTATIQQGVSIPLPPPAIIGGTSQGWQFLEAVLILEVTPHVASHASDVDKRIVLDIRVANNEPTTVAGASQPGMTRKEAKTTILLKDGETAVIGGIFKITKSEPVTQVPFLGNLPLIGKLFQDRVIKSRNEEMIIFLTPQIVEPGSRSGAAGSSVGVGNR